ncbi:aminotransferase class I/II-fold pyridoxal phosphate-dependent enzyme [Deltaproteobacteria bacterium TL4]
MMSTNHKLKQVLPPPSVSIADRVRHLLRSGISVAQLQTGEPHYDTPQYIIEGAYKAMCGGQTHYSFSAGLPELRQAIVDWYQEDLGTAIKPGNVLIHSGAIHAIYCVIMALLNEGDQVIIPEPFWNQYANMVTIAGGKVKNVDTRLTQGRLTLDQLKATLNDKVRLLILNNPCNPSGVVYSREEIASFLNLAAEHQFLILFDEVYNRILFTDRFCSSLRPEFYTSHKDRILYVNSFSKTFAMTGWRVGYSILPDEYVPQVLKVSQNTITNVNPFCQIGAYVAITQKAEREQALKEMQKGYQSRHEELSRVLKGREHLCLLPEGAFYLFFDCKNPSENYTTQLLETQKIALVPGTAYGQFYPNYCRASFATDAQSFERFLQWLSSYDTCAYCFI